MGDPDFCTGYRLLTPAGYGPFDISISCCLPPVSVVPDPAKPARPSSVPVHPEPSHRSMHLTTIPTIVPLYEAPEYIAAAAALIHEEFWRDVPGASVQSMQARLAGGVRADCLPLSLVALHEGQVIGVVNLVDNDDDRHLQWHPWLAGMVVAEPWRGKGVGSALVLALLHRARELRYPCVYFGTDGPGFYTRLGAAHHEQPRADFWFMRFDLR